MVGDQPQVVVIQEEEGAVASFCTLVDYAQILILGLEKRFGIASESHAEEGFDNSYGSERLVFLSWVSLCQ